MLPVSPSASHAQASARPVLRRRLGALTAAAVLIVSAVACSGGGTSAGTGASPTVDPYDVAASMRADDGATAAPSGSLSSEDAALRETALAMEAPEKPTAMSENSPEGAVAAAEYFISLYPYVYATGDLTEWDAVCEATSKLCSSVSDYVEKLHAKGGWGDPWTQTIKTARSGATEDKETLLIELTIDSGAMVRHMADGSTETDPAAQDQTFRARMHWSRNMWLLQAGEFK